MITFNNSHSGGRLSCTTGKHFHFTELNPEPQCKGAFRANKGGSGKEKSANSQHPLAISLETGTDILYDLVNNLG